MKLLEYEAKSILRDYSVPVPASVLISSAEDTLALPVILKSQVPVGGRGKAGGIQIVSGSTQLKPTIEKLLRLPIKEFTPKKLLAEEVLAIDQELYLSLVINKEMAAIELVAHNNGGVEVEENDPSSFLRTPLTEKTIITVGEQLAEYYTLPQQTFALQELLKNLLVCFTKNDATLLEINPLVLTTEANLIAGDCKMELDDAAAFRHPEWNFEAAAAEANFVTLDTNGTIATIANGAGLAMATVDAVADMGMKPANFLDIGGGANEESVYRAFERIIEYPHISAIVINIFAGITRCDEVARAIIAARNKLHQLPPLFIRLSGTNFEEAATLLNKEGIAIQQTLKDCLLAAKEVDTP